MIEDSKQELAGVICMHCGMHTPLPVSSNSVARNTDYRSWKARTWIVRCRRCGKEAPYSAGEIMLFEELANSVTFAG